MSLPNGHRPSDNHTATNADSSFDNLSEDPTSPSPPQGPSKEADVEEKELRQAILDSIQSEPSEISFDEDLKKALEESSNEKKKEDRWREGLRHQRMQQAGRSAPRPSIAQASPSAFAQASPSASRPSIAQGGSSAFAQTPPLAPRPAQAQAAAPVPASEQAHGWQPLRPSQVNEQSFTQSPSTKRPPAHQARISTPAGDGKCFICKQPFKAPTPTPCGHTFCYECLMESLAGSSEGRCPMCGKSCGMVAETVTTRPR